MKRFSQISSFPFVSCLFLSVGFFACAISATAIPLQVEQYPNGSYRITFSHPRLTFERITENDVVWTSIQFDGALSTGEEGEPSLPVQAKMVRIPDRGNVALRIGNVRYHDIENIDVLPIQAVAKSGEKNSFRYNESVYATNALLPDQVATISQPVIVRDARVVALQIHPVQANPVTRTLRVYDEIELEILSTGGVGENEHTGIHRPVPSFAAIYRDMIGAEDLADECDDSPPGQILILAIDNVQYRSLLNRWIDWKTSTGHPVQSVFFANSPTTSHVYDAIANVYLTSNPPLEYIQLAGGTSGGSGFVIPTHSTCYDHLYMCQAGNDTVPDIAISRFSASDLLQMNTMVMRTIKYESQPWMTDTLWYTRGFVSASLFAHYNEPHDAALFSLDMMHQRGIRNTNLYEFTGHVNTATIYQNVSPGLTMWAHCGMWVGQIDPSDITGIENLQKPFVAIYTGESTGNLDGYSLSETATRLGTASNSKGAIAAVGTATNNGRAYWYQILNNGFAHSFGILNQRRTGDLLLTAKLILWQNGVLQPAAIPNPQNYLYWTNMVGDGTVPIWTGVPQTITANFPDTIPVGQSILNLTVLRGTTPEAGARVTVTRRDSLLSILATERTDSNGIVALTFENRSPGDLYVTIVGEQVSQNLYPVIDTIHVVSHEFDVAKVSCTVYDTPQTGNGVVGNSDGTANPGERIQLRIQLRNNGLDTLTSILGVMRSYDPRIIVVDSSSNFSTVPPFPIIVPGDTVTNMMRLLIELRSGLHDGEMIPLQLHVNVNNGQMVREIAISVLVLAHRISFVQAIPSVPLEPGVQCNLAVSLRNDGPFNGGAATVRLASLSPAITVLADSVPYSGFPTSVIVTNGPNVPFRLFSPSYTLPGTVALIRMTLTSASLQDTLLFPLTVGTRQNTDPSGPDAFGYIAYEDQDGAYSQHPVYNWVEIIPQQGGSGTLLPLNNAGNTDTSLLVPLPFPIRFYGNVFDSMVVCDNGWLSLGGSARGVRSQTNVRLPPCGGPRNLIAPFWDDLIFVDSVYHGVYYFYDANLHRLIVTWLGRPIAASDEIEDEFQAILYDTRFYRNTSGNSPILFQYRRYNNINSSRRDNLGYATTGISDGSLSVGLEVTSSNQWMPGFTPISNDSNLTFANRTILFVTSFDTGFVTTPEAITATVPSMFVVDELYPNPFNAEIQFRVALPTSGELQWIIYDAVGRIVYQSSQQTLAPGNYRMNWNGRSANGLPVSSGIYFLKVQHSSQFAVQKIVLLR